MAKKNAENSYNTNLASEYLMMSLLSRTGKNAYLSLGNKKGVDIVVTTQNGGYAIIEVKGVNENMDWMVGNTGELPAAPNLFYALIGFQGKINDINAPAKFYMIPSESLKSATEHKISKNEKTVYISHKHIRENYGEYLNSFAYWMNT
ncbi:MAG: hypothetical protein WCR52_06610 [Bacteroidota bacterium]